MSFLQVEKGIIQHLIEDDFELNLNCQWLLATMEDYGQIHTMDQR